MKITTAREALRALENLPAAPSSEARRTLLRAITDLFLITSERMNEAHAAAFGDAMRRIACDVEEDARAELSHRIADRPTTPRNLAISLGNDTIVVAQPILERCVSLTDEDLVAIARSQGESHQLAIAKRAELSEPVTDLLVERGAEPVLDTVCRNAGARFSGNGFETAAQRGSRSLNVMEALSDRADLPHAVREQVGTNSARIFESELQAAGLDLSLEAIAGVDAPHAGAPDAGAPDARFDASIDHLYRAGKLSEDTIRRLSHSRRTADCVHAIALLTDMDAVVINHCLFRGPPQPLAIVCRALSFSRPTFRALVALRKGVQSAQGMAADFEARAVEVYYAIDAGTALRILRFLKVRLSSEGYAAAAATAEEAEEDADA